MLVTWERENCLVYTWQQVAFDRASSLRSHTSTRLRHQEEYTEKRDRPQDSDLTAQCQVPAGAAGLLKAAENMAMQR